MPTTENNEYTLYGNTARDFILELFQTKSELSRKIRGEKDSYRIVQSEKQKENTERKLVIDHFTIEMYRVGFEELDFVKFEVFVSGGRRKEQEEDGKVFIPALISLSTPEGQEHFTSAVLFPYEYLDEEEPNKAYQDEIAKWESTFNDFIAHAHIIHYKNLAGI